MLLFIELVLFLTNYKIGTYFVGWDNLFPELNPSVNISRSIFAVWQEYRGVGLLDGMSFAANLPHYIFVSLLSLFLPQSILRYFFVFFMHFLGGIGIYLLLQKLLGDASRKLVSFAGALFYLFNLNTIQMFFAPYELFLVHFAFLPWLTLFLIKYLQKGDRRDFVFFVLFSVLAVPQGHVPTVFLVYLLFVLITLLFFIFWKRSVVIKRSAVVLLAIFSINAYWLTPYVYSAPQNAGIIIDAKINQMSSEEVFSRNKVRGNLANVVFMKGFLLDMIEPDKELKQNYIMVDWQKHVESSVFWVVSSLFLAIALLGMVRTILKREMLFFPFIVSLFVAFFFLGSDIWGLGFINQFLRERIPILGEVLRFSFTKFAILFAFVYSIFFAIGVRIFVVLFEVFFEGRRAIVHGFFSVVFIALLLYSFPAFKGAFLFDSLRLRIPPDYSDVVDFFRSQSKNERVATLPQYTFWSWRFTNWGYRGSGFLWYGIPQPTLDRAFDPWSDKNENFYWEISYAIYSDNLRLFEKVLEKYQVSWLLVDESIINPSSPKSVYLDEIYNLLLQSNKVEQVEEFGFLKVYKVNLDTPVKDFKYVLDNPPVVEPTYKWGSYDEGVGGYISATDGSLPTTAYYPFRSLFTGKRQEDLEFEVEDKGDYYAFQRRLSEGVGGSGGYVEVPEFSPSELQWINPNDFADFRNLTREVFFDGERVEVKVPKVGGYLGTEIVPALQIPEEDPKNCNRTAGGRVENQIISGFTQSFVRLTALDATNCSASFSLPSLPHNLGYLITVEAKNVEGKPLLFWIENLNSRRADMETYLPKNGDVKTSYFVQPPMEEDGLGYTLHFDSISIGREKSVNDLGRISINPVPYKFLSGIVLRDEGNEGHGGVGGERKVLVYSQAYHKGWTAFRWDGIFPRSVGEHVLVNNWANGWILNEGDDPPSPEGFGEARGIGGIRIIFLPQLLEYLGFILAGGFVFLVIKRKIA